MSAEPDIGPRYPEVLIYSLSMILQCCDHDTGQNQPKEGKIYWSLGFLRVSVYHSGKGKAQPLSLRWWEHVVGLLTSRRS